MPSLLTPDTFEFLARFFLAGWVFLSARSWWVKGERPKPNEVLFEAIILSLLNQLVTLFTLPFLTSQISENATFLLVTEVFLQPLIFGMIVGVRAEWNRLPDGARRLLMPAVQPVNSALAFAVDQIEAPTYLIISYTDGRQVYGYFGERSFARSEGNGGIFIESLYTLSEDEDWIEASPRRGGWVTLDGALTIEFISSEDL